MTISNSQIKYWEKNISPTFPDQAQHFFQIPSLSLTFQTYIDFDMIFPDFPVCTHPVLPQTIYNW